MVVSRDKTGDDVLEAWAVSVDWVEDANGKSQPTVNFGSERSGKASLFLSTGPFVFV